MFILIQNILTISWCRAVNFASQRQLVADFCCSSTLRLTERSKAVAFNTRTRREYVRLAVDILFALVRTLD